MQHSQQEMLTPAAKKTPPENQWLGHLHRVLKTDYNVRSAHGWINSNPRLRRCWTTSQTLSNNLRLPFQCLNLLNNLTSISQQLTTTSHNSDNHIFPVRTISPTSLPTFTSSNIADITDDLDVAPGPDPTHRHALQPLDINVPANLFHDNAPHLTIPKHDAHLHLNVGDLLNETAHDTTMAGMNVDP
jgi:hypothetical protein